MREAAGFLLANGMFAVVGLAILWGVGMIEARVVDVLAALGLGFLCGIAALGLGLIVLLVLGVPVTLMVAVAVAAIESAAALALGRVLRRNGTLRPVAPIDLARSAGAALVALLGVLLCLYFVAEAISLRRMPVSFDAAHIWTFKATALTYADHLQLELFDNPVLASPNYSGQDYPILQPVFLSVLFRAMGGPQPENVPLELWLLMAAFVAATAFLLGPRRGPLVVAPPVAATLAAYSSVALANADATAAVFVALGAVCCACWIEEGSRRHALLAGLLLGAAANVKAEGLPFTAAILFVALMAGAIRRPPGWLSGWGLAAGATAIAVVPWRLWMLVHDPPPNQPTAPLGDVLDPSWLSSRSEQLRLGASGVVEQIANQGRTQWAVAGFLAAALTAVVLTRRRGMAGFYLASFALSVLLLIGIYWTILAPDFGIYLDTSVDRVVLTPMLLAAVGLAHLMPATSAMTAASADAAHAADPPTVVSAT